MTKKSERHDELETLAQEVCARHSVGVYDLDVKETQKGRVVVLYLVKADGVTLDDCRTVSRDLGAQLDILDPFVDPWFLEVSSAGLERKLRYKKHYTSAIGENVKITYSSEGKNASLKGELAEVHPEYVLLRTARGAARIAFSDIKKARTIFDIKASGESRKGEG
ncbi:MAG: hypothetical protein K8R90_09845 [Candidatus Cloacimonetes bacterium]|nr:hypothetical protein [Candidatus Cloacimonadota bacterium]